MFPRKKKNRTGTISVVVVDKSRGGFKEVKNFGVAKTEEEADRLYTKASEWVRSYGGQQEIDFVQSSIIQQEFLESERVLKNISAVVLNGPQQILNQVYESIGFNRIKDEVLRHLVIARICQPLSKSATADYLKSYFHEDVSLDQIYRYMDKLYNKQRELVQQISVEHTRKILGGSIGLMFYDVTSLYFETGIQDELRTNGFSKDGKTSESQIILGLLVSALPTTSFRPSVAAGNLSLAVRLPLLGCARDLHPLDYAHVGRTKQRKQEKTNIVFFCFSCFLLFW